MAGLVGVFAQFVARLQVEHAQLEGRGGAGRKLGVDGGVAPSQTKAGAAMSMCEAQERLNGLGYNVGTPDGAAGPKTAKALREFQQAQGLPVTGKLDTATAGALSR